MFESLSDRLQETFKRLRSKGKLTEADVETALREVRIALLEADVSLRIVKLFINRIHDRAVGVEVLESLSPAQQVIKIVHDELVYTFGEQSKLTLASQPPTVVMLVGLQGSGKTTTAGKLALSLRKQGQRPLMVAADVRRPAAIQQIVTLGKQIDIPVYSEGQKSPPDICQNAVRTARQNGNTVVILDTAGRLHIDEEMMQELVRIKEKVSPHEILLVADAMTGQDAGRVADSFNTQLGLTGVILTKMDGDARGGAALSVRAVTGVPIKYAGISEKLDGLEPFYPDRIASRILGMGDVLSLIEKAQESFDQKQAEELQKKIKTATFDLDDFLNQLQTVKKMGPLQQILEMLPGFGSIKGQLPKDALDDKQLKHIEAIISSMTPKERHEPHIIGGSRRRRIARGSGTTTQEVNQLLHQFTQVQKMMKMMGTAAGGKRGRGIPGLPPGIG